MFVNRSGRNEHSLQRTFHRCFLPSFRSFGQVVSEEKNFLNRPIRNKNCLWRPCLLKDRDEMSKLYRGLSIDASYQVSVHLAKEFQRRRLKCEKLTDDRRWTTDAKWWQKLTLPLARWAIKSLMISEDNTEELLWLLLLEGTDEHVLEQTVVFNYRGKFPIL